MQKTNTSYEIKKYIYKPKIKKIAQSGNPYNAKTYLF